MSDMVYTLPENFGMPAGDTLVYFYSSEQPSSNNRVIFTKNLICLLQHGTKEVFAAGDRKTFTNSDVLMLTAGSTLMSERMADGRYEAILIFIGNTTLADFCAKQGINLSRADQGGPLLKIPKDSFLKNYCNSLQLLREQENLSMNDLKVQEILSYISLAFPGVFREFAAKALQGNREIHLKQAVEMNLDKGLTIEELAFLCNMSASTFKRHFAIAYGTSPQKYFTARKMEQSQRSLSAGKRPSEVYAELGYESLSAFSSEFKKHFSVSPKQFQTQNGLPEKAFEPSAQQLSGDVAATL